MGERQRGGGGGGGGGGAIRLLLIISHLKRHIEALNVSKYGKAALQITEQYLSV